MALLFTSSEGSPKEAAEAYIARWAQETTHQEVREHLGVGTLRQYSDLAIERAPPLLFGLYSLVCLIALDLQKTTSIPIAQAAWYKKQHATFVDLKEAVCSALPGLFFNRSGSPQGETSTIQ